MSRKGFRCGYEDHLIEKCPNPTKESQKRRKKLRFNEKGNCACNNGQKKSNQKIYAYMVSKTGNDECPGGNFGDSSQLTNWILVSGATCQMTTEVADFIQGLLEDMDKN